ncbi:HAD superfamily hydrolase (TIGR01459 family) [Mycoplana sp. BE70]|uniref:TIGR01459 family HAD-type hydrolase n=1 Tax=Mycoplana sp. BE70 TaxID=2817775 RepID=UPI002858E3AC|nr:TIGR01459 family HAD-type hydrolase [Mycoplana sp. BE70]MDR6758708.1 HAD superfamily hydrolase (TIGR01459 family) [Mycoplana sp. BE70]
MILPRTLVSLCDIAEGYRAIVLDLFGTIHDGVAPLEGALDALIELRRRNIAVCLLSNSPRRSKEVAMRLAQMDFTSDLYSGLVTSGELAFEALSLKTGRDSLGDRYLHVGPAELANLLAGSGRTSASSIDEASFLLATGTTEPPEELERVLGQSRARGLPMVCANPDRTVLIGDKLIECAGGVAKRYELLGGAVLYHGKPFQPAYAHALHLLGVPARVVLAIGDSLETDVAGANKAGIDAALVLTGLHKDTLRQQSLAYERLHQLCLDSNVSPKFVLPTFSWNPKGGGGPV